MSPITPWLGRKGINEGEGAWFGRVPKGISAWHYKKVGQCGGPFEIKKPLTRRANRAILKGETGH